MANINNKQFAYALICMLHYVAQKCKYRIIAKLIIDNWPDKEKAQTRITLRDLKIKQDQ